MMLLAFESLLCLGKYWEKVRFPTVDIYTRRLQQNQSALRRHESSRHPESSSPAISGNFLDYSLEINRRMGPALVYNLSQGRPLLAAHQGSS
jgi:hypothetical protein